MRLQLANLRHPHLKTVAANGDGFVFRWIWAGSVSNLHSLCCILSTYILRIIVPEPNVCVCTHPFLLSALSLSSYLHIQGGKALLQLLYSYFSSLVRQPSLACLLHCSVSTVPSCLLSTCFVSTSMLSWHCSVMVNIS